MINQVTVTPSTWIQIKNLDEGYLNFSLVEFDEEQWELYEEGLSDEWPYDVKDIFSFVYSYLHIYYLMLILLFTRIINK